MALTPATFGGRTDTLNEVSVSSSARRRRGVNSTRLRMLGWYMALLFVAIAIGLLIQRAILLNNLDDEVNAQLNQEVKEVQQLSAGNNPATGQPFGSDIGAIFSTFLSRNIPEDGEALFTIINGLPYASTFAPVQLLEDRAIVEELGAIDATTRGEFDTEAGRVRYLAAPVRTAGSGEGVFVVAIFLDERRERVNDVIQTAAIAFATIFAAASVVAWLAAGRILRPVTELTEAARSITDDNWSERIPVRSDDQIGELTQTFNEMLDRLESSFVTHRQFIDDAGHELRTPITIIRGHLELLETEDRAEREETMRLVMDELDRMARMVDDLLLLARASQPDFLQLGAVDVASLIDDLAAKASALGTREWTVGGVTHIVMIADGQRVTQAMMNLLRNAVEHSPVGSRIELGARAEGDHVELWVRDEGEGISSADQARVFQRFARGTAGQRTSDGAGLGLSIVRAIAEAHGGHARVESVQGAGSMFLLSLPVAGPKGPTEGHA